mmetsp:Transcript_7780/g.8596  ORF Transcript_7780/g.8596 Transcript_7780/m.8596 type:complete len:356 (-) Transcript_7780:104-1171(-)
MKVVELPKIIGEPSPNKTLHYSIGGIEKAGALYLYHNNKTKDEIKHIVLCCAGFADDHQIFMKYASDLSKSEKNTLVGVISFPGYDHRPDFPWTKHKRDGYTFEEWILSMKDAVKLLRKEENRMNSDGKKAKFTAVYHDWGVVYGLKYTNRVIEESSTDLIPDKVVLFDVLTSVHPKCKNVPSNVPAQSRYQIIVEHLYRVLLAVSFWIGRYVSSLLAPFVLVIGFSILGLIQLSPLYDEVDGKISRIPKVIVFDDMRRLVYMAHPYYYFLCSAVNSAFAKKLKDGMSLPLNLERTPILYMYGTDKPCDFHDLTALQLLKDTSSCKVVSVPDAGHYLYIQQPQICLDEVIQFMNN